MITFKQLGLHDHYNLHSGSYLDFLKVTLISGPVVSSRLSDFGVSPYVSANHRAVSAFSQ